jgi:heavy metal translocating P-type ATPase
VLLGGGPDLFRATFAALAVLVLGYPCALGMSTPLAMIRGGGDAAEQGILMRSGEAFQIMGELRAIVLDKTGTITRGEPEVRTVVAAQGVDEDELVATAAAAEAASEHPLASAVTDEAARRDLDVQEAGDFTSHTGKGVEAVVDGATVLVGKPGFLTDHDVDLGPLSQRVTELEEQGMTVVGVTRDGALLGVIAIGDAVKPDAAEAIQRIRDAGMTPVMLTGDNARTARAVAEEVGIDADDVRAEVLPDDKAAEVRRLQEGDRRVAMVGDGINDAPALTQADVGIAIGAGTDIAIESADIVVMSERLGAVMDAHQIGVRSYRRTKQNLALAFSFNGIGVPLATTGLVHPVWAMVAMVASVTAVLGNTFRGQLGRRLSGEGGPAPDQAVPTEQEHDHADDGTDSHDHDDADDAPASREAVAADDEESDAAASEQVRADDGAVRLHVPMHCGSCSSRIERRVGELEGVREVTADHDADVVTVDHDEQVTREQLRETIHAMGFDIEEMA